MLSRCPLAFCWILEVCGGTGLGQSPTALPQVRAFPGARQLAVVWQSFVPGGDSSGQCPHGAAWPLALWGVQHRAGCPANPRSPQASQLGVYKAFVDNYKIALETAEKCSQSNYQFQKISEVSWTGAVLGGWGCHGRAVPVQDRRTETAVPVAELTLCALQRCSPCPGDSGTGPSAAVLEGHGLQVLRGSFPMSRKLRLGSALAAILSGTPGQPAPAPPSIECGCWVLGTCGSSPAGCIFMPGSPIEMGTSVVTAWLPAPSSPPTAGLSSSVGPAASPGCCGAGCPALGCPVGPLHPSCWALPELLPARQHPMQSVSPPQHTCVVSSVARLGLGGDTRVQEGWGGDPHDLEE